MVRELTCKFCGNMFIAKRSDVLTCSLACKHKFYRKTKPYHKNYKLKQKIIRPNQYRKLGKAPQPISRIYFDDILEIYTNVPEGHQVDHIIPITSDMVCGLHVPWNLQYITVQENRIKGNKIK